MSVRAGFFVSIITIKQNPKSQSEAEDASNNGNFLSILHTSVQYLKTHDNPYKMETIHLNTTFPQWPHYQW